MTSHLTIREKEHWMERIANRVENEINRIITDNRDFFAKARAAARESALAFLGIKDYQARVDAIDIQIQQLTVEKNNLLRQMVGAVAYLPKDTLSVYTPYEASRKIQAAVARRQLIEHHLLMSKSQLGRRVLSLRTERDNLLESVRLATSPKQVHELWQAVDEVLGERSSALQQDTLTSNVNSA